MSKDMCVRCAEGSIKTVIFDIGGVLCNYAWREFLLDRTGDKEMADRLARATVNHATWREWDIGNLGYGELVEMMCENDPEVSDVIRKVFCDIRGLLTPRDYAIPWVEALHDAGYRVLYLSNMSRHATEQCPVALGFIPYTDGGILSFREHIIKPNQDFYLLLQERYHLISEECVFLDDSAENVEAAVRLGWKGIVFTDKASADEQLKALGVNYRIGR